MVCRHKYFRVCNGKLVCVQCGKPADERSKRIKDKIDNKVEIKKEKRR